MTHCIKVLLLFVSLGLSPQLLSKGHSEASPKAKLKIFVYKAAQHVRKHGKKRAFEEFNKKGGTFSKGALYIFGITLEGIFKATPNNPEFVGKNILTGGPENAKVVTQGLIDALKEKKEAWYSYRWRNPKSGNVECKRSFVIKMEDLAEPYFIGAGYYDSDAQDCK